MPKEGDMFQTSTWGEYHPKRTSYSRFPEPDEAYSVVTIYFAKQFARKGNLRALCSWITNNSVTNSDTIEVEFLLSNSLKLSKV